MAAGHSVDDYLETIYFLAFPIGEYKPETKGAPTLAVRVADMLGVSRASAGEMLKRLEAEGLVERGEHKEAILTAKGRENAERVVRKHRIIERLLTDFMGYTAAEAHVQADLLGNTFTDDMVDRIEKQLGNPDRCPHGWPVDVNFEQAENRELKPLADLAEGESAEIVRLAEHDGELLHWYYDEGLVPGARSSSAEPSRPPASSRSRSTATSAPSARRPPRALRQARCRLAEGSVDDVAVRRGRTDASPAASTGSTAGVAVDVAPRPDWPRSGVLRSPPSSPRARPGGGSSGRSAVAEAAAARRIPAGRASITHDRREADVAPEDDFRPLAESVNPSHRRRSTRS